MNKVRMGIIGCGAIGSRHAAAAADTEYIDLVAVADSIAERAVKTASRYGALKAYDNGQTLLDDDDVDAVVLALPTQLRQHLALTAFAQGKNVLLEKPAAMNATELTALIAARGELTAASASSRHRFLPSATAAAIFLKSRSLGPLRSIFVRAFSPAKSRPIQEKPTWRLSRALNGGGILVNWGCYDLDYMLGLIGWAIEPLEVSAQTWTIPSALATHVPASSDGETHVTAFVRCRDEVILHVERGEYVPLQTSPLWEILGTDGALRLHMLPGAGKQIHYDWVDPEEGACSQVIWEGDEDSGIIHQRPIQDFAEAILFDRSPATTLEHALLLQEITDAIYASSEHGCAVAIAEHSSPADEIRSSA